MDCKCRPGVVQQWRANWILDCRTRYGKVSIRRGTQVVRERSAKPLCVGSIPTRAPNIFPSTFSRPGLLAINRGGLGLFA